MRTRSCNRSRMISSSDTSRSITNSCRFIRIGGGGVYRRVCSGIILGKVNH